MTKPLVLALALAWTLGVSPALAGGTGGACKDDVKRLCAGVKRGGGALSRCLDQHRAQLSKDCAAQRAKAATKAKAAIKPLKQACADEIEAHCDDVTRGQGRLTACLKAREDKLSAGCRAALEKGREQKAAFGKACGADLAKHCHGAKAGRRHALKCLREFQHDLSPACKAATGL